MDPELVESMRQSPQYRLYVYERNVEGRRETVALLGEAHTKSREGSELGKRFLRGFRGDIGVEGVDWDNFLFGKQIRPIIYGLHTAVGIVAFGADRQETTTVDAREIPVEDPLREVVRLEKGHEPDLMENASLLIVVTMMARTGTELTYRGGKLVVATGNSLFWLARQSPRELASKTALLAKRLAQGFGQGPSLAERLGNVMYATASLPMKALKAVVNFPASCVASVQHYFGFANDPTRDFPFWKRLAVKADSTLKIGFTSLFGANIYLYYHPEIPIGLINKRNSEMVRNGVAHLEEQDDDGEPRPLLVIAGMAHLKGWSRLLEKEGFALATP